MNNSYGMSYFGSAVASINELRATFPVGGYANLLMLPHYVVPGPYWPFPSSGMWSPPGSWDNLQPLFYAMSNQSTWQEYETTHKRDELRDTCLVHHFHLDSHRNNGQRSSYRWFAFRDPLRFGNVWFNLGGTYRSLGSLRQLWTSPEWMRRLKQLYPWVAAKYRIRGNPGLPAPAVSRANVRHIWNLEKDCYPVVSVSKFFYLCAGGRARNLDLERCAEQDRWTVAMFSGGMFAKFLEADPESMLHQLRESSETADRMQRLSSH